MPITKEERQNLNDILREMKRTEPEKNWHTKSCIEANDKALREMCICKGTYSLPEKQ